MGVCTRADFALSTIKCYELVHTSRLETLCSRKSAKANEYCGTDLLFEVLASARSFHDLIILVATRKS